MSDTLQMSIERDEDKRYSWIFINEEPFRKMDAKLLKNPFFYKKYLIADWDESFQAWEEKTVKSFILSKLKRKRRFSSELIKLLKPYGFLEEILQTVIKQFESLGYLNDEDGVESIVRYAQITFKGPFWIKEKLRSQGVFIEITALDRVYPKKTREEVIFRFLTKKGLNKDRKKMISTLARRGFSLNEVLSCIKGS